MTTTRSIRAAVLAFVRAHDLLPPGPLVVAVSGGADSTALLLLLADLAPQLGLDLHVAHFDHRLRPRASAKDAQFVADLAQRHSATIRIGRAAGAPASEDAARELRKLEPDHRVALSRGGSNRIENILPSCHPCNARKHRLTEAEFRARLAAETDRQPPYT